MHGMLCMECCACRCMDCCPARLLPPWASAHSPPARRVQPHGLPVSPEAGERAQGLTPAKSSAMSWPHAPGTVCFMRRAPAVFAAVPLPLAQRTGLGLFEQWPAAALQRAGGWGGGLGAGGVVGAEACLCF